MRQFVVLLLFSSQAFSQDSLLTYTKVLHSDSLSKGEIYDRSMIWFSRSFGNSKSAIFVQDKNSGIIGGKAYYQCLYKIPTKKDSVLGTVYRDYYFNWTLEIKDGRCRFSIKDLVYSWMDVDHVVTTSSKPPVKILFQSSEKTELEWKLSKQYFIIGMDQLMSALNNDLMEKKKDF